jgi:16S rRNA (guanine(966)-N(2))-methyltransferase RsmD
MRIIAGRYRGRLLPGRAGAGVRPATDRVRGAIFNILQNRLDLRGIDVLDLFAGTGSLGFEALSRGAANAVFVDEDRHAVRVIRENAEALGCADDCEIVQADAAGYVSRNNGIFGLIFADPPYDFGPIALLPGLLLGSGLAAPDGYVIIEHRRGTAFAEIPPGCRSFTRAFGATEVSFFHRSRENGRDGDHDHDTGNDHQDEQADR